MTAPFNAPFARRVDDALRRLQATLLGAVEVAPLAAPPPAADAALSRGSEAP